MKTILTLCFSFSFLFSFSQHSISGKIYDNVKKPARGVTVLLLRQSDSSLIVSAITNGEGEFLLKQLKPGSYFLKSSMVGFASNFKKVEVTNANVEVGGIQLSVVSKTLQDVTVVATKPFLEQRADRLIVNIEGSATAAGSTALEVLQKVPGVMILNDKVSLAGKNSLQILIDGRLSPYQDMSQVLRDMSASNIEKIEVISNPGAKYDATGGAVINIILKRNINLGTHGSIGLVGAVGIYNHDKDTLLDRTFYRVTPSIAVNHRKGKLNLFGGYNYLNRNNFELTSLTRQVSDFTFIQANYAPSYINSHNYRFGADLFANRKNTFGVLFRGFYREGGVVTNNQTEQVRIADRQLLSKFKTLINQDFKRTSFAGNINWKHSFDTTGKDLNVDFDYGEFQINNSSDITTTLSTGSKLVNNQTVENPVKIGTFKIDYTLPFGKDSKLETGVKSSIAKIDNYLTFSRNNSIDTGRSNTFLYNENINAAYASFQKKLTSWEFIFGLRTEQTLAKGNSVAGRVLDRNYWQLYPSAFITRKLNKNFSAVAQYSRRVARPSYQQQNPFIVYLDSLTYTRGNPLIKPETTDATKLSLTYQGQPFFSVSYNQTSDVIFQNAPKQEGNLTYTTVENLASFENVAFELNFPIKLGKKVSGFGGNQFVYNHYKADYLNSIYDRNKWHWLAYGQIAYKPTTTLSIETSFFYSTRFLSEFLAIEPLGNLNFAVSKLFLEKKLRVALNYSDVFFTQNTKANIDYQDIRVNFRQKNDSRSLRLALSYSFGNQKLKEARNRATGSEAEQNRVKAN